MDLSDIFLELRNGKIKNKKLEMKNCSKVCFIYDVRSIDDWWKIINE
jgi:hypothetical protein